MAVQSDTSSISYTGNNSTSTSYSVPFVFQENSHLAAIAKVTATGVESAVTLTNHTGAGDPNGGTVRTAVAVPATSTLTIFRTVPATQTTTYQEGGDFPAASHERALDKLTFLSQQNERAVERSFRVTEGSGTKNEVVAVPNTLLGLDASNQPKALTVDQVKSLLAITGVTLDVDAGMKTFADAGERALAVPDFAGQLGTQRNTGVIYVSTGTAAGEWTIHAPNFGNQSIVGGSVLQLADNANIVPTGSTAGITVFGRASGYPNGGGIVFRGNTSGAGGVTDDGLEFYSGGSERIRLTGAGLLGVNTTTPTTALEVNGTVTATAFVGNGIVPAGAVMSFATSSPPAGWIAADGAELSKTGAYAALFSAIGTSFGETNGSGGAGTSHFRVPDLRGIFVRGSGSQTISGTSYSGTFAAKQNDQFKAHKHQSWAQLTSATGTLQCAASTAPNTGETAATSTNTNFETANTGGTETNPANISLLYCVKF